MATYTVWLHIERDATETDPEREDHEPTPVARGLTAAEALAYCVAVELAEE